MNRIPFIDCIDIVGTSVHEFEGSKLYISTGAVDTDKIDSTQVEEVTYQNRPSRANLVVKEGDVLFAKMQATNKTIYIDNILSHYIFSTGFFAVRAKEGVITPSCLYLLLSSDQFLSQKDKNCSGATQKAITNNGLKKINISIPNLSVQEGISKILFKLQLSIVQHKTMLDKYDALIKSRFVEMFGDPILNNKKWIVDSLGAYMTVLTDFSANGSYELLDNNVVMYDEPNYAIMVRTTDFENGDFTSNLKYIDQTAYELLSKSKLFGGELIMNKIGSAGKIYIMPNLNYPASLGRNAFMFRFNDQINTTFLYYLLTSDYGTKEIQQYVRGAVTKTITKDSTRKIKIIVPPIESQNQFADFVTQVEKQKATVQQSIDKLETLKKSLMQEYFG